MIDNPFSSMLAWHDMLYLAWYSSQKGKLEKRDRIGLYQNWRYIL